MRKLVTKEEIEKTKKKEGRILAFFLLLLLIGSTAGFAFLSNPDSKVNNPEENTQNNESQNGIFINGYWNYIYAGEKLYFLNSPKETSDVLISINKTIEDYYDIPLYIATKNNGVLYEINSNLKAFASRTQEACYGKCEENLPEKGCGENLIVFKESTEKKVYQQENCVFIDGDLTSVDAFLYKIFNIE